MATTVQAQDLHLADDLAHALEAGSGESTVESQHIKAIAVLTAKTANSAGEATAITAALALLNTSLTRIRDPRNH